MCIIGCGPKLKIIDFVKALRDELIDLDNLNSSIYNVQQIKISLDELTSELNKRSKQKNKKLDSIDGEFFRSIIKPYIRKKIKNIQFFWNDYLYQGCVIYCKGTVRNKLEEELLDELMNHVNFSVYFGRKDIKVNANDKLPASLRPTNLNLLKIGDNLDIDIRLLFIASHNKCIRSYFYNNDSWIHILNPQLSTKYLKHNKNLKREDYEDEVKIYFFDSVDEINESFIKELEEEDKKRFIPIAILCKGKNVFEKLKKINKESLSRMIIVQNSWI
jgi:hypothetical protein